MSRRQALRAGGLATAGLLGAALIGCGEDDGGTSGTPSGSGGGGLNTATTPPEGASIVRGGTLRSHWTGDPPTIDPIANTSVTTKEFAAYVYSRFFRIDTQPGVPAGAAGITGDLAESAETDDGQRWVVRLREGVKFHNVAPVDGRTLDAEDIQYSWEQYGLDVNVNRETMSYVDTVETPDDRTVVFNLRTPQATFLDDLADTNLLWIYPKESDSQFSRATTAIGTGPWILDEYQTSVRASFNRNPDFYEEGVPYLDRVERTIIPEYANSLAQFQAGNLDLMGVRADDVLQLRRENENFRWTGAISPLTSMFYFDHVNDPSRPWADDRVRKAFSLAIDRDALLELGYNVTALRDAGLDVATSYNNIVPVGHTRWWLDPQSAEQGESAQYFRYAPDEARQLLEAAGYPNLELEYHYTNNRYGSTFNSIAEANIGFLTDIGLKLNVLVEDYNSQYITQTSNGDFSGVAFGYETPFPEAGMYLRRPFEVDANGVPIEKNRSRVDDPEIRDIGDRQAAEFDEDARRELMFEGQRLHGERMWYVPNQAGAGMAWSVYQPYVENILTTRGYGDAREEHAYMWFNR